MVSAGPKPVLMVGFGVVCFLFLFVVLPERFKLQARILDLERVIQEEANRDNRKVSPRGRGDSLGVTAIALASPRAPPVVTQVTTGADEDSGRLVFIDLGANCGNSYKRLIKKKLIDGPKWEAFLWEANPQMVSFYLNDLAKADKRVRIVALAAWVENKKMEFFLTRGQEDVTDIKQFKAHQCRASSHYQPSGASSLFSGMGTGGEFDASRKRSIYVPGKAVTVDAVDFAEWMGYQKFKDQDRVVLKIDIEGAEIPLLRHLLADKKKELCKVDHVFVEWHSWMLSDKKAANEVKQFEENFIEKVREFCGKAPEFGGWH